jgi:sulfite exporter TauE/SafE
LAGGRLIALGRLAGIERAAAVFSGASLIVAGILLSGVLRKNKLIQIGGTLPRGFSKLAARLLTSTGAATKFALGAVMGFLPCGLIYAALLKSIDGGSPAQGALSMLAFAAGTTPALFSAGLFSTALARPFGRYANTLATLAVFAMGVALLWRGLAFPGPDMGHHHGHLL